MADSKKKYGLILSKKKEKTLNALPKTSIFGNDSSDEDAKNAVNQDINKESKRNLLKKQTKQNIEKALAEDPNIFDYDAVYDDMQATKKAVDARVNTEKAERKSRYVESLLKTAEKRNRENERRVERKVQKEREEEKGMYDDKESFVTSAYREKMRLMQEEEEKERRMEAIEEAMDVKKQRDLSGFYRHILNQTTGSNPGSKVKEETKEPDVSSVDDKSKDEQIDFSLDRDLSADSSSSSEDTETEEISSRRQHNSSRKNDRKYRQRKSSSSNDSQNSDSETHNTHIAKHDGRKEERLKTEKGKDVHRRSQEGDLCESSTSNSKHKEKYQNKTREGNLSDGDRHKSKSSRSRDSSEEKMDRLERKRKMVQKGDNEKEKKKRSRSISLHSETESDHTDHIKEGNGTDQKTCDSNKENKEEDPMAKYAKRNVGEKFDDARMRYFMRKQMRVIALAKDED